MSGVLIRGASLLGGERADLLLRDGRIAAVGSLGNGKGEGVSVVDADGLIALPGLVDLHTHLREPGREDAETIATGSAAAAVGGYTAVLAMANTVPGHRHGRGGGAHPRPRPGDRPGRRAAGRRRHRWPGRHRPCRARSDGPLPGPRAGLLRRRPVRGRRPSHAAGPGVRQAVRRGGLAAQPGPAISRGAQACCHEGELSGRLGLPGWPGVAEEVVVARDVMLARHTASRVHVAHVSTAGSVEVIRWAKAQGIAVTAEVTPHHLMLTTDLLRRLRPGLQGQPTAAPSRGRRGTARRARRRHHRRGRHRPCPARPTRQGARVRRCRVRGARA